jgi:hypothetical protein
MEFEEEYSSQNGEKISQDLNRISKNSVRENR